MVSCVTGPLTICGASRLRSPRCELANQAQVHGCAAYGFVTKRSRNSRSAFSSPSSVRATDLALPTGSEIRPFSCNRYRSPVERLPNTLTIVPPQQQEREHTVIDAVGFDCPSPHLRITTQPRARHR